MLSSLVQSPSWPCEYHQARPDGPYTEPSLVECLQCNGERVHVYHALRQWTKKGELTEKESHLVRVSLDCSGCRLEVYGMFRYFTSSEIDIPKCL